MSSPNKLNKLPEIIFEIANSHDGNKKKLISIINEIYALRYKNKSIKFQIFSANGIAETDYKWYPVYKEITFSKKFWSSTLRKAHSLVNRIWIDIFDEFGLNVFKENITIISGIKLQASTLENLTLTNMLAKLDLSNIDLIINISGYSISEIKNFLVQFRNLNFKNIILQIGFQNYPTKIKHTGLQKIPLLKEKFDNMICVADHVDGTKSESLDIPIFGLAMGANMIEKHVCIERMKTKYDYFSSLEPNELSRFIKKLLSFVKSSSGEFVQKEEKEYLIQSLQLPLTKNKLASNSLVNSSNVIFKRTNKSGLTFRSIKELQQKFYILKNNIDIKNTIKRKDFKKASIGVIVAGRMKSSRLKKKAILKINGKESIKICLESCLKIKQAHKVILATSTKKDDEILSKYLPKNKKVHFFQGHPENVIKRYIDASEKNDINVIIRVTADCPFVSSQIATILLDSHFKEGADYTAAKNFSVGTSCEIINLSALKKIALHFKRAQYSEYMTWYFQNNKKVFKINLVDLPNSLIRDYRLTLDYEEDLMMFDKMARDLSGDKLEINQIFNYLDNNHETRDINSHLTLKYKADKELIKTLNTKTKIVIRK